MFNEQPKVKTHTHLQNTITAKQNGLLSIGIGKCQHLLKWFG
jgi:hypothetical protein